MLMAADAGHVDVLAEIEPRGREAVLSQCVTKMFKAGQRVWNEGDSPQFIGFIVDGKALSMYHARNGRAGATGVWAAGDVLGGASIYDPRHRQTSVKCLEPCTIHCLGLDKAHEISESYPQVGRAIIYALSARLRWANHLTHILQTLSAFERIAGILLSMAERFPRLSREGTVVDVPLTHEDWGALVGVTRQFATITLHELQQRGLILVRRREIVVSDMQGLRALTALG